jgi:hypothetical protein
MGGHIFIGGARPFLCEGYLVARYFFYPHAYAYPGTDLHAYAYSCTYIGANVYACAHTYGYTYANVYTYIYVNIYTYTCVHTDVYALIYAVSYTVSHGDTATNTRTCYPDPASCTQIDRASECGPCLSRKKRSALGASWRIRP